MVYIRSGFCFKVIKDLPSPTFSERAEYKPESIVLKEPLTLSKSSFVPDHVGEKIIVIR